ncbi:MAG TPA: rod shape-determining protein MreC [Negativicutes bacterium]|nr:rod shape-determining protein MreC [Negativicutes bacterium]
MRHLNKKAVILTVAVITVFLLAVSASRGKYNFYWSERIVTVVLAPVEYVVSKVGYVVRQTGTSAGELFSVYQQNQVLREENDNLRRAIIDNTEIVAENARLKALLDYRKAAPQFDTVIATVIARDPAAWTNIIVINRGTAHGIAKDMAVITPQGLVGSVVQAYGSSAKVQLVLDPRSAVGGLVQRPESRVAAIVEGNAAKPLSPKMVNIARDADIIKGDKIITSGFGGIYPKGILLGEVTDVVNEEGGLLKYAVLKPAADFDRLEEVAVIVRSREPIPAPPAPVPPPATKGAGQ